MNTKELRKKSPAELEAHLVELHKERFALRMQQATGQLTSRQIEAARRSISRYVKRGGKMWIRVFPDKPITKKPIEVRMGSGKGNVEFWVAQIQPGRMIYEIEGVDEATAREAFRLAAAKLSVTTQFVTRTVR